MDERRVVIENLTNGSVGIHVPELRLKRRWERKGVKKIIPFDVLQEALYDPGVEYMFTQGILYIDDMKTKQDLGLEPEEATVPENVIILTDAQKKRYLTVAPLKDLKEIVQKLSHEQVLDLVDFAIANELIDIDKDNFLKKITNVDIVSAIQLNRQSKDDK